MSDNKRPSSPSAGRRLNVSSAHLLGRGNFTRDWSLARKFLTSATALLLPAMTIIGWWVGGRIESSVVDRAASSAALYVENFMEPLVQELSEREQLSAGALAKLARLLTDTTLGQRVQTFKIWARGDAVVASNKSDLIGRRFPATEGLNKAWSGAVSAELEDSDGHEPSATNSNNGPFLEIYIPIRKRGSDQIIAVGEFYEFATDLRRELNEAKTASWIVFGTVTLAMLSTLFIIVWHGSETIREQQAKLQLRVDELTTTLADNAALRRKAQLATARASESHEQLLQRLGADLHDGPAQLISLALLRLDEDSIGQPVNGRKSVREVLEDALKELRQIAEGLAAPEIDGLTLPVAASLVVQRYQKLAGHPVSLSVALDDEIVVSALTLCICRFVQEGLSNGLKHAPGMPQSVSIVRRANWIIVDVTDAGPGPAQDFRPGLGLRGLKDRIESLGGSLSFTSTRDSGFRMSGRLPVAMGD